MIGVRQMMNRLRYGFVWVLKAMVSIVFFLLHVILQFFKWILMLFCLIVRIFMSLVKIATP